MLDAEAALAVPESGAEVGVSGVVSWGGWGRMGGGSDGGVEVWSRVRGVLGWRDKGRRYPGSPLASFDEDETRRRKKKKEKEDYTPGERLRHINLIPPAPHFAAE